MARQNKRKKFFIKKNLQGKLIFGFFLFVTGGSLFFLVLLGAFSADTLTISYINQEVQSGHNPFILLKNILASHWIFILSGTIFICIAALLLSHRIAGPMFRFELVLDNMLNRDLSDTIYLRSQDEGKELATKINAFNQETSTTFKNINSYSSAIVSLLERAESTSANIPEKQLQELKSIYWNLKENNKKIGAASSSYTLMDE